MSSHEIPLLQEIHNLKRQLASKDESMHFHYYDQRVVIVIQNLPVDLKSLSEPLELWWYNKHNNGPKYTKAYLPAQTPSKCESTGEITVDLMATKNESAPSIQGIYPVSYTHLTLPTI